MEDHESVAQTALRRFASRPAVAMMAALQGLCTREELEAGRRALLRHLDLEPPVVALDAVGREACAAFGFLARSEARSAGLVVPFDAVGLDRMLSKA